MHRGADSAWGVEEGFPEAVTPEMGKSRGKDALDGWSTLR